MNKQIIINAASELDAIEYAINQITGLGVRRQSIVVLADDFIRPLVNIQIPDIQVLDGKRKNIITLKQNLSKDNDILDKDIGYEVITDKVNFNENNII